MSSKKSPLVVKSRGRSSSSFSFKLKTLLTLICPTVFLFVLLFSFSSYTQAVGETTGEFTEDSDFSILSNHVDSDGDGLSDALETMLGTEKNDKYGDYDNDGLYDFEEYLNLYGNPDVDTNTPKYKFNESKTYGGVKDIYHHFNLTSDKTDYVRDNNNYNPNIYSSLNNHLLWNVTFSQDYAGGTSEGSVTYSNNILRDVTFSGDYAGGTSDGSVTYSNNVLRDVTFSGIGAGGNFGSFTRGGSVRYTRNTLIDVTFSGSNSGGSQLSTVTYESNRLTNVVFRGSGSGGSIYKSVTYASNTFNDVIFRGSGSGGSQYDELTYRGNTFNDVTFSGDVAGGGALPSYTGNTFNDVTFSGPASGGSQFGTASYTGNTFDGVTFSGDASGGSYGSGVSYINNTFDDVVFNGWYAGGSQHDLVLYEGNNFTNVRYDKSTTSEGVYGNSGFSGSGLTNYTNNMFDQIQYTQLDGRVAVFNVTYVNNTIVNDSYDSDGDGLSDISELFTLGTDPGNADSDGDNLNDSYELDIELEPLNPDTDGDGLNDGWEIRYNRSSGVNPFVAATEAELGSDVDQDGYTLLEEAERNTDPEGFDSPPKTAGTTSVTSEEEGLLTSPLMPLVTLMVAVTTGILIYRLIRRSSKHTGNEQI